MKSLFSAVLVTCLTLFAAGSAQADKLTLSEISGYFNGLTTARGTFTQVNGDGSTSSGILYISRPGRMRFEYDPPEQALVLASANAVVIIDKKSNQPPETYPLRRTPLSLILARRVNLGQARMVVGHEFDGTSTIVTAQDPKNADYGTIQMHFAGDPVRLQQWVINDATGVQTTVVLDTLETGLDLKNSLFDPGTALRSRDR
ncbi:outer membrane lipoprotein carrier protein LolA [Roseobacter sp.]|uniref:LolA family protein n=1 Tax=Roseobacter sp. TaxID=1907202 RepID=UPI00329A681A